MTTQSKVAKDIPNDLIDELLVNYQKPEELIGENGLLKQLTKKLVERALQAEMTEHLGHDKHAALACFFNVFCRRGRALHTA